MTRVLIVDDYRDMCWLLQRILEQEGYRVSTRTTGKGALGFISRHRPDLIFLALTLPDMSGPKLIERVRALHVHLPVVILSSPSSQKPIDACKRLDPYAIIPKPFQLDEVVRVARSASVPS